MSTFTQSAKRGDVIGILRQAIITGSLWAIALSWSGTIREVTSSIITGGGTQNIIAELVASLITTAFGTLIAIIAARQWCRTPILSDAHEQPPPVPLLRHTTMTRERK